MSHNQRNHQTAGPKTGGHQPQGLSQVLLEPGRHDRSCDHRCASSGPKSKEEDDPVEHEQRLGPAEKDESQADGQHPCEDEFSCPVPIGQKPDQGGEDPHLHPPQADGERNLGVAPPEFLDQGVDKCSETEEEDAAYVKVDDQAGQDNPPAIENLSIHGLSFDFPGIAH